jgi:two-component system chemotaxis sensor kinase CheA
MDTMLFSINETFFLIPLENVEVITVHNPKYILERERAKTIAYNNNLIPFLDLRKTFIKDNNYPEKLETIIITKNEKLLAIVADKIIGEHQAVLKNIGKEYKELEFLSGASILADGNIALMLDPGMLFDRIKSE